MRLLTCLFTLSLAIFNRAGACANPNTSINAVAPKSATPALVEFWTEFNPGAWREHSIYGQWYTRYGRFVNIRIVHEPLEALELRPPSLTRADTTHAGLVTSTRWFGNILLAATITTVKQLRSPTPNPWEVGWLLWHFRDDHHFYYIVLKPNGWELGKKVPSATGQQFLLAGATPAFPLGTHTVQILQVGPTIQAFGDGRLLGTFIDRQNPYMSGGVGLYTADAYVRFGAISAQPLP